MKLLLDNGLSRSAVARLNELGFEALHVGSIGLAAADDAVILDRARSEGAIVVTLDADFHSLLALAGLERPSVIRIRIEGLDGRGAADLIARVIRRFESELSDGAVMSVSRDNVRCHLLPIGRRG